MDTATLSGPGQALDFTKLGTTPVDKVALGSFGGNSVKLALADVLDAGTGLFTSAKGWTFSNTADNANSSTYHQLVVSGSGTALQGDSTVALASAAGSSPWALTGTATQAGTTYNVYTNLVTDNAQLLIDQGLKVNTAVL